MSFLAWKVTLFRENFDFQAFQLASEHLHIHPLLEVDDMLSGEPDERSVMTYVSQFIQLPSLSHPPQSIPVFDIESLEAWLDKSLRILRTPSSASLYDRNQVSANQRSSQTCLTCKRIVIYLLEITLGSASFLF